MLIISLWFILAVSSNIAASQSNNQATVSMYHDCCRPSSSVTSTLKSITSNGAPANARSENGCVGNPDLSTAAFADPAQKAQAIDENNASGYASAYVLNGNTDLACACYELSFIEKPLQDKKMVVQISNVDYSLGENKIALFMPGTASGTYDQGCKRQYGAQYMYASQTTGFLSSSECYNLPPSLQSGCEFRFAWFKNADKPKAIIKQVACPSSITSVSQCTHVASSSLSPAIPSPPPEKIVSTSTQEGTDTKITGCTNTKWQQCAGRDFTGQTCCPPDTKCVIFNEFYAQCQP